MQYGFEAIGEKDTSRQIVATDYARANNILTDASGNANWWTRSPYGNRNADSVAMVGQSGLVSYESSTSTSVGVVPAMWIKL